MAHGGRDEDVPPGVHEEDFLEESHPLCRPEEQLLDAPVARLPGLRVHHGSGLRESAEIGEYGRARQDDVEVQIHVALPGGYLLLLERGDRLELADHPVAGIARSQHGRYRADRHRGEYHGQSKIEDQAPADRARPRERSAIEPPAHHATCFTRPPVTEWPG